jgi:hypothetical protein
MIFSPTTEFKSVIAAFDTQRAYQKRYQVRDADNSSLHSSREASREAFDDSVPGSVLPDSGTPDDMAAWLHRTVIHQQDGEKSGERGLRINLKDVEQSLEQNVERDTASVYDVRSVSHQDRFQRTAEPDYPLYVDGALPASDSILQLLPDSLNLQRATHNEVLSFVLAKNPSPSDHYAIAAVLEMAGMRDADAQGLFGQPTIFALARVLYAEYLVQPQQRREHITGARVRGGFIAEPQKGSANEHHRNAYCDSSSRNAHAPIPDELRLPDTPWRAVKAAFPLYLRGLLSNAPWAMQIASLALFGCAFGVSLNFSRSEATAAGIGMALSLIGTGGFIQTIGRLASFYLGQQNYILAQQLYYRGVSTGLMFSIIIALLVYAVSWFTPTFPPPVAATSAGYYVLFSSMTLCLSMFYVVHHYRGLIGCTFAGVVVMALVHAHTTAGAAAAHWSGIVVVNITALFWMRFYFQQQHMRHKPQQSTPVLPRSSVLAYGMTPYFAAGTLYFVLLFADRFVNWTTNAWLNGIVLTAMRDSGEPVVMPVAIYPPYEIGLMWAFLAFTFATPLLEYIITNFVQVLMPLQRQTTAHERDLHNSMFMKLYLRFAAVMLVFGVLCAVWTFDGVVWLYRLVGTNGEAWAAPLATIFSSSLAPTESVYYWASAGYVLLSIVLLNNLLLFSLARPWLVVRSLCTGIAVNFVVGWTLAHSTAAWMSVIGLCAGAAVAACLGTVYVLRLLRKMDFHFYSAF